MAPRTIYANLQDGLQPFSLWDQSLADMGSLGITPCTAAGTNAIVLTPIAVVFPPNVTTPQALQAFSFVAAATSTGSVTVQIGSTAALKLYRMDGVTQAAANDILINVTYVVNYNAALNGAAGGFQILAPISNEINPIITGATISGSTITTSTYNGNTWTAGTGILTIAALKTLTASNTLTLSGTDGTTMTFPTTSATIARTDASNTFTGHQTIEGVTSTGATGTGNLVFSISPTFTTPALGIATATTLNGNTFTTGTYTLTGVAAKTLTFNNSLTLAGTDSTTITFQASDTYVGRATTDTLTNKTFDTAGAGNSFKINGTAITANTGTGNNVLATTPTISQANLVGTTTNDSAAAGSVGEFISSTVLVGSAVSLTTATPANITSISLTAGDWDVSGTVAFNPGGTTTITQLVGWVSSTSAALPTLPNSGGSCNFNLTFATGTVQAFPVGKVRFSLSGTTTIFLSTQAGFGASTMGAYGFIGARRVR